MKFRPSFCISAVGMVSVAMTMGPPLTANPNQPESRVYALFEHALEEADITVDFSAEGLSNILKWSSENGRMTQCVKWLDRNIEKQQQSLFLRMALADALLLSENWPRLNSELENVQWFYQEHIRLAYRSKAQRALGEAGWNDLWLKAIEEASSSNERLQSLLALTSMWKDWEPEIEAMLWAQVIDEGGLKLRALKLLNQVYLKTEDIAGLMKLNQYLLEQKPDSLDLINNSILYAIFNNEINSIDESSIALFIENQKTKSQYQLTVAFYLHFLGQETQSKTVMESIPDSFLEMPDNALYAAAIIASYDVPKSETLRAIGIDGHYASFERDFLLH